jgi:hypothetical protein
MHIDVFNGDADGLCALHQWRLAYPADSLLVTGVKRDIRLLSRVHAGPGDSVTVFDIALRDNRDDAERIVEEGATLIYFDHHEAAGLTPSPRLTLHLDAAPETCTSLLVDRELGGAHRPWAIVAAFGDNLDAMGGRLAAERGLSPGARDALAELGRLLNYNAYGDTPADLHFHPADLYRAIRPFQDPLRCHAEAPQVVTLRQAFARDWDLAAAVRPVRESGHGIAVRLPPEPWARRIHGTLANRLAASSPPRAVAVLVENADGTVRVSVRAPSNRPQGADRLCRGYSTGGGRALAAGISRLPAGDVDKFLGQFEQTFAIPVA